MVIDLDLCIGCNACVSACNVENNVLVVGKDQVARGREMPWLRIDRYYTGDVEDAALLLPAGAVHALREGAVRDGLPGACHRAFARRHQPDGLQPLHRHPHLLELLPLQGAALQLVSTTGSPTMPSKAAKNPDVTVRSRGVMEKCTYLHAAHPGRARCRRQGEPPAPTGRGRHRLPAGLPDQGHRVRRSEGQRIRRSSRSGGAAGGTTCCWKSSAPGRAPLIWRAGTTIPTREAPHEREAAARPNPSDPAAEPDLCRRHRPARRHSAAFPDAAPLADRARHRRRCCSGCCFVSAVVLFTTGVGIWGLNIPVNWAFAIHNYVWWLGIGHAGTLISALLLLLGRDWRNSLNRFAETMTLFAVVCAGIYPILHLGRPWFFYWMFPYPATMGVWPQFRSPLEWDIWAVLHLSHRLDRVLVHRPRARSRRGARPRTAPRLAGLLRRAVARLARLGACTGMRWHQAYRLLAALAVPLVVSVHSEVSLLFAAGTIPGWHSTIFPPYFVLGAAFSGFAVVAMIAIALRALFHLAQSRHRRSSRRSRQGAARLRPDDRLRLCVRGVRRALFRRAHELQTLHDRFAGEYAWSYWGAIVFNFVVLQPLWWRRRAAHAVDAVHDLDQRRHRHVARALHDPGHQPLPRFPGVLLGRLSRRRSGTGRPMPAPSGCSWCRSC